MAKKIKTPSERVLRRLQKIDQDQRFDGDLTVPPRRNSDSRLEIRRFVICDELGNINPSSKDEWTLKPLGFGFAKPLLRTALPKGEYQPLDAPMVVVHDVAGQTLALPGDMITAIKYRGRWETFREQNIRGVMAKYAGQGQFEIVRCGVDTGVLVEVDSENEPGFGCLAIINFYSTYNFDDWSDSGCWLTPSDKCPSSSSEDPSSSLSSSLSSSSSEELSSSSEELSSSSEEPSSSSEELSSSSEEPSSSSEELSSSSEELSSSSDEPSSSSEELSSSSEEPSSSSEEPSSESPSSDEPSSSSDEPSSSSSSSSSSSEEDLCVRHFINDVSTFYNSDNGAIAEATALATPLTGPGRADRWRNVLLSEQEALNYVHPWHDPSGGEDLSVPYNTQYLVALGISANVPIFGDPKYSGAGQSIDKLNSISLGLHGGSPTSSVTGSTLLPEDFSERGLLLEFTTSAFTELPLATATSTNHESLFTLHDNNNIIAEIGKNEGTGLFESRIRNQPDGSGLTIDTAPASVLHGDFSVSVIPGSSDASGRVYTIFLTGPTGQVTGTMFLPTDSDLRIGLSLGRILAGLTIEEVKICYYQ